MAPDTTPPGGATRYIQTTSGILTYSQLAPLLAAQVLRVERSIAAGAFTSQNSFADLVLDFHREIAVSLCPDWAGQWRNIEVRVGEHCPPSPFKVPMLMRDYGDDLRVRLTDTMGHMDDQFLETLAFAEGRLLSIHPFTDFNGRVTRLLLRELLRRLEMPPVDLLPTDAGGEAVYRTALRAGDGLDWRPLVQVWRQRFEQFSQSTE